MEGKGYGQPPGSLDLERQEGQGRGDLVCHVAELQRQEWNIVPTPPREAPQLHSPCSPAWGLTRARKVSEIPLHAQASLPPSSARLPMPVFGEQNCQDRESGRIRGFGAEQQGGGGFAGSVCVSSEEGVERMTVCLWMSARARAEMRASCGVERSCIWGDVQRAYRPYSTV